MSVFEAAAALEASPLGEWMRSSSLAYPIVNVLHLLGLVLLVGPILLLDLRLLGAGRQFALADVSRVLTHWSAAGLLLLAVSGSLLFSADAAPLMANRLMQVKLVCIALGIANALLFHKLWRQALSDWDAAAPLAGKAQAILSLSIWLTVGTLGRWIAYV